MITTKNRYTCDDTSDGYVQLRHDEKALVKELKEIERLINMEIRAWNGIKNFKTTVMGGRLYEARVIIETLIKAMMESGPELRVRSMYAALDRFNLVDVVTSPMAPIGKSKKIKDYNQHIALSKREDLRGIIISLIDDILVFGAERLGDRFEFEQRANVSFDQFMRVIGLQRDLVCMSDLTGGIDDYTIQANQIL